MNARHRFPKTVVHNALLNCSYPYFQPKPASESSKGESNKDWFFNSTDHVRSPLGFQCSHWFLQENKTKHSRSCKTIWTLLGLEHKQVILTPKLLKKADYYSINKLTCQNLSTLKLWKLYSMAVVKQILCKTDSPQSHTFLQQSELMACT